MTFQLTSPSFPSGGKIPAQHSCDGGDVSPQFHWSGAPAGTASFALICSDPDAPAGTWYHWAAFDIPATATGLPEHVPAEAHDGIIRQAINDFGRKGYGGPCPPRGHGPHHYHFTLYALKAARLPVTGSLRCRDVERIVKENVLARTELIGLYGR